jgi:hypothetical protein
MIVDAKAKFQRKIDVPLYSQQLLWNERSLENGNTVADYEIPREITLNLIVSHYFFSLDSVIIYHIFA